MKLDPRIVAIAHHCRKDFETSHGHAPTDNDNYIMLQQATGINFLMKIHQRISMRH